MDPQANEDSCISQIGYPQNINATYGLMDASGTQLQRVLSTYGQDSAQGWFTFDNAYAIAEIATGMLGGGAWYHWVAIRGVTSSNIWIANSAPGYKGIYDTLSREQFNTLGPFSVVYLE